MQLIYHKNLFNKNFLKYFVNSQTQILKTKQWKIIQIQVVNALLLVVY
jgi:hypothetical protein